MTTIATVKDLIAELSKKDPDARVFVASVHHGENWEDEIDNVGQYTDDDGTERVVLNDSE